MEVLWISLLGGLLALDATSAGQFMVSRPLISGTVTGWALGDAATGLVVGALLELYLLVSFPSGGARFPEGATATVVAVASATAAAGTGAVALGVAIGLVWGQVGGITISVQRKLNGRFIPEPGTAHPERVTSIHLAALAMDFVRGSAVTLVGALTGRFTVGALGSAWPLEAGDSLGLLLVGGAVSAGILLRSLGGFRRRRVLFAVGIALGVAGARLV